MGFYKGIKKGFFVFWWTKRPFFIFYLVFIGRRGREGRSLATVAIITLGEAIGYAVNEIVGNRSILVIALLTATVAVVVGATTIATLVGAETILVLGIIATRVGTRTATTLTRCCAVLATVSTTILELSPAKESSTTNNTDHLGIIGECVEDLLEVARLSSEIFRAPGFVGVDVELGEGTTLGNTV
ncbi:hypothetical protein N8751_01395 [bacterium]|nr:hypothetical protein [bacterium]